MTVTADVDGVPISALVREVPDPRAVVVALHGGAASAAYFHYPGCEKLSLVDFFATRGFTVVALDRPGYGASSLAGNDLGDAGKRVELAYAAVDRLVSKRGAGLFLLAHSAGSELAVRMASSPVDDLLGVELAGTGRRFQPEAAEVVFARQNGSGPIGLQKLLWEPRELYPPEALGGARFVARAPAYESELLARWAPREFALEAPRVRVPVQYTLGEYDRIWRNDSESMAEVASLFTGSPRVVVNRQPGGGHNLSLGLTAPDYHARVLSFVERCLR
ncbi:lysophospholipase [Amycolatopsis acidicola]|uniref:Lysophospholipase n=1 Tax=Amycolatopsis acidicola TaxID=2596893 RepID=A0A5N0UZ86_9PSEU|nr:alpha/beta fold hydrolase [Amycolatopsis acidicola]KAA9155374.1 lysophospholipase [Amycolatopsis acidicola]